MLLPTAQLENVTCCPDIIEKKEEDEMEQEIDKAGERRAHGFD